jgi:hypothetical protein
VETPTEIFPFDLSNAVAEHLFTQFMLNNKRMTDQIEHLTWSEARAVVIDHQQVQFETFTVNVNYDSYDFDRRDNERSWTMFYYNGELDKYIKEHKVRLALHEFERREEERLKAELHAKVAQVYREMFGEDIA